MRGPPIEPRPAVDRAAILGALGAGEPEVTDVLRYTERPASVLNENWQSGRLPALPDEPFVGSWSAYAAEAGTRDGVWQTLRRKLIQLRFTIGAGRSTEADYRAATRSGVWPEASEGLELDQPAALTLHLQPTAAGHVPVLFTPHQPDFVQLVQALAHRNEPWPVPASQSACCVAGYTNWDRVRSVRTAWEQNPSGTWEEELARLLPQKSLYQDTIILLGNGPYSSVPASTLGFSDEEWLQKSLVIRREHECAHYVTRRFLGALSRRADEELPADFFGLAAAFGRYPAEWGLRFLGLENFPAYRSGGRLENYRTCAPLPPLSDRAFGVLVALVHAAAHQLESSLLTSRVDLGDPQERARCLLILSTLTLEELAAPETSSWLGAVL